MLACIWYFILKYLFEISDFFILFYNIKNFSIINHMNYLLLLCSYLYYIFNKRVGEMCFNYN